jgi:hypothetical protein
MSKPIYFEFKSIWELIKFLILGIVAYKIAGTIFRYVIDCLVGIL